MIFKIGGSDGTDIVPLAAVGGIKWKRINVDGGNGMTMADGTVFQDRIAARYEWTFAFRPLSAADQAALLTLLRPKSVSVLYTDPQTNDNATDDYYISEVPAGYLIKRTGGTEYWGGITATFSGKSPQIPEQPR